MQLEIEQLIVRYLSGEASPSDVISLENRLNESESNRDFFLKIKAYWNSNELSPAENTLNHLLQRVEKAKRQKRSNVWLICLSITTAAMIVGAILYYGYFQEFHKQIEQYHYMSGNDVSVLTLPDGTKVSLNKNTTLSYSNLYGEKVREVKLDGEAFFEVTKNPEKQFVVDLNGSKIAVLGTVFNVRNNAIDSHVETTLLEGSIRFEMPDRNVMIKPSQQLSYSKNERNYSVQVVDPSLFIAWKDHLLKYRSLTFEELTALLEKQYNVSIDLKNSRLKERRVSGTLDIQTSVEQILNILKQQLSFKWIKQNNKYEIK